jgi:hypothetical protein
MGLERAVPVCARQEGQERQAPLQRWAQHVSWPGLLGANCRPTTYPTAWRLLLHCDSGPAEFSYCIASC